MLSLELLFDFSRNHCVAICAFLVPTNLFATLQTIVLVGLGRPQRQLWRSLGLASVFAIAMILHVLTWFMIGVVMAPTFILMTLACVCLSVNLWAVCHPASMRNLFKFVIHQGLQVWRYWNRATT